VKDPLLVAAGVATAAGSAPAGLTTEVLGHGRVPRAFAIQHEGIKLEAPSALDVLVARLTFAPGIATGWQIHPGPMLAVIARGSLTRYAAEDCNAHTYSSGLALFENGPSDGSMVRNEGSVDAEVIMALLAPSLPPLHRPT
jgi:hypothetical protein